MTKKQISIIALDPRAGQSYGADVRSLFGDVAEITIYAVADGTVTGRLPYSDLFVVSTDAFPSAEALASHIPPQCPTMAVQASFKHSELERLKTLPSGEKILFVNMTHTMAREAIAQLEQFGINHVQWVPFYPHAVLDDPTIRIGVTPDEMRYMPAGIETTIDIGQRVCTSGMMIEIALRLNLEHLLKTPPFVAYFQSVATNNYSFDKLFDRSFRLASQFHILMDSLSDGVIAVDERGIVFASNHQAQDITHLNVEQVEGQPYSQHFPYIPFGECLQQQTKIPVKVIKVNGTPLNVEVVPILREGTCMGAFAILQRFDDMEDRQTQLRSQLFHKGHYAKYGFEDVIGTSAAMEHTKTVLRRMAQSESPVLLIGETGTGKELFAHAVHRASRRSAGPFVAINVAAVPENLLESQLFGYEDGAFTGAKKGGSPGLFEFSHRGTLFLDEVEGMSMALQVKLLRALQEREVMRVGGNRIIQINVRIIATTNESLEEKIQQGTFRRDLYYRLCTLPALIPPLTQRGEDLMLIMEHFKQELGATFTLSPEVSGFFHRYRWPGNIRELRNVVEYLVYTGQSVITMDDLPPR
ncbi:sigma 54-interacting transcriptional regulator [Bengtsoniella intestinalis]|uniref:sigma-54 interaction domain-containing protein n=1 Tax=Bengtsoniella intestinalis TaxID=3073143 RepID=UPI00391F4B9F